MPIYIQTKFRFFFKRRGVGRVSFLISFMFSILKTIELPTLDVVW